MMLGGGTCTKNLRGNLKPRVSESPEQTKTGLGSGNILKNIFGSGWVSPGWGIFTGVLYETFLL